MWDQLGKNAVFRRAEERAMDSHSAENHEGQDSPGRIHPERDSASGHEEDFNDFDRDDDRSFADAIR